MTARVEAQRRGTADPRGVVAGRRGRAARPRPRGRAARRKTAA
jgi:hypothetical protein